MRHNSKVPYLVPVALISIIHLGGARAHGEPLLVAHLSSLVSDSQAPTPKPLMEADILYDPTIAPAPAIGWPAPLLGKVEVANKARDEFYTSEAAFLSARFSLLFPVENSTPQADSAPQAGPVSSEPVCASFLGPEPSAELRTYKEAADNLAQSLQSLHVALRDVEVVLAKRLAAPVRRKGVPKQRGRLIIQFASSATPQDVTDLITRHSLKVVGGLPELRLIYVNIPNAEASGLAELEFSLRALQIEPSISAVMPNVLLSPSAIIRSSTKVTTTTGAVLTGSWDPSSFQAPSDVYYWLKIDRFPQAWNFSNWIRNRGNPEVVVGLLDVGFGSNPEINLVDCGFGPSNSSNHGQHIASIIAAKAVGGEGIVGANEFVKLIACSLEDIQPTSDNLPQQSITMQTAVGLVLKMILEVQDLKVINLSIAYNWKNQAVDPYSAAVQRDVIIPAGKVAHTAAELALTKGILLVSAAGNDSSSLFQVSASLSSPFNWAAANKAFSDARAENVIVVESTNGLGKASSFSNREGCLSAPGERIAALGSIPTRGIYLESGTSLSAPQVTAAIALMYAYFPNLQAKDVLTILNASGLNCPTDQPTQLDVFDLIVRASRNSLHDLANLNHDDRVDMEDFKIFRSALLQVEGDATIPPADLNGDGMVDDHENWFPRADLNGSGVLSRVETDRKLIGGSMMSDLEVLVAAWEDTSIPKTCLVELLKGVPCS